MVGNTDIIEHCIFKGIKDIIINMISDVGHKLLYVLLTLSVIHLYITHYNNTNIGHKAYVGYLSSNINIFSNPSVHMIHI